MCLGRQHEKDGWLIFTQHKGRNVNRQHLNYLVTNGPYAGKQRGYYQPFEFGKVLREAVRAASLDGVSAHGLRKAFSAQKAEQENSTSEIAALDGWDNLKQVETYTKSARRQKLAENVVSRRQERAEKE